MNDPLLRRLFVVKIISSEAYRIRRGSPNILNQDPICLWGEDFEFAEFWRIFSISGSLMKP